MKAAYYHGNRTIKIGESIRRPPGPDEVRLNVAYCGVCGTDLHIFRGGMDKRVAIPQVIGHEMAGEIAEVGANVKGWAAGERVVVRPLASCGTCPACCAGHAHICYNLKFLGIDTPGAFQSSWTAPAHTLHRLPPGFSLDQAALIEPIAVACHDVRLGMVKSGEEVVVIGGGPIGLLIALVAAQIGARVLISEVNPFRLKLAREFGLEAVNPKETDLADLVGKRSDGAGADVVFEVSGSAAGAATMTQLVRARGRIVIVAIFAEMPKVDLFRFFWRELHLCGARVYEPEDFDEAISLAARGTLPLRRLISDRRPLADLQTVFEQIEASTDLMKVLIDTRGE
ncbi:MAG: alcohol dehydrogenase catalytic domain-containing protein [Thermodesulfobacteriota bacterium]|nr:alcohol dehydrogenase catalytic domain-containing protein [Thermodesulfobacteriota bacterium]